MRIFIDIGHQAHVHYFKNMIKLMQERDKKIDFLIAARDRTGVFDLLRHEKISYFSRGKGANNVIGKIFYLIKTDIFFLFKSLRFKPDLFVSFSSPYAAHVAALMRKPHIAFSDTEHAKLTHMAVLPFTKSIITPSSFYKNFGKKQIIFNGTMELCYLHKNRYTPDKNIYKLLGINEDEKYCLIRFVSWKANHDLGYHGFSTKSKIEIVSQLINHIRVFISSESVLPIELQQYKLNISKEQIHNVIAFASLYIGEGATMASESSVLGIPTIYVNSLPLMGYLKEEQKAGLLFHFNDSFGVLEKALEIINSRTEDWAKKQVDYLFDKIDVTAFMVWFIENYPQSEKQMRSNPAYQLNFK